ncbi:MAG: molybdopterin-dependent oxidoreductase [Acidobacteriota bacterium]
MGAPIVAERSSTLRKTICTRDCPDACGIVAEVTDGRVLSLRGDKDHPVTRGFLCERTNRFLARQYSPERVVRPLLRRDGVLREASWDEALSFVVGGLRKILAESGPKAVFHYRSGGSLGILKMVNDYFFELLGDTTIKVGDICSGAGEAAQVLDMGVSDASDHRDILASRCIVLWGKNVHTSFLHMLPELKEARAHGARIVLIDIVPHRGRGIADLLIVPRPGCDRFLALGVARALLDAGRCAPGVAAWSTGSEAFAALARSRSVEGWAAAAGVTPGEIGRLAAWYGDGPSNIQVGWGLQRRRHGGATVRLLDALAAMSGNLGRTGGGVVFYYRRRSAFDVAFTKAPPGRRTIVEPLFAEQVTAARDPGIRALFVDNANPVAMLPDSLGVARAIESRELSVVLDSFLTDTAARATVVLPTTTMLEEETPTGAYGHHYIGMTVPVAERPGGVRSDIEIYAALAERLGLGDRFPSDHASWTRRVMAPISEGPAAVTREMLLDGPVRNPRAERVIFAPDGGAPRFPTDDGKFHFVTEVDLTEDAVDPEYPLTLGSFSTPRRQSSQLTRAEEEDHLDARVHPGAAPGFGDGDLARLESRLGSIIVRLRLDPEIARELVMVPKGGSLAGGLCANVLVRARTTDFGLGAAYYDEKVRLTHVR